MSKREAKIVAVEMAICALLVVEPVDEEKRIQTDYITRSQSTLDEIDDVFWEGVSYKKYFSLYSNTITNTEVHRSVLQSCHVNGHEIELVKLLILSFDTLVRYRAILGRKKNEFHILFQIV